MEFIIFLLNLPFTCVSILPVLCSIPYRVQYHFQPFAIVVHVKSFWWSFGYLKNARAMTIGHVILLSPKILKNDFGHEIIHVQQCEKYPVIYPFLYLYELIQKGYRMNRFEDEAYIRSKSFYNGIQQGI